MPEYGRATGGVINAVTKSGSNEFHGLRLGQLHSRRAAGRATTVTHRRRRRLRHARPLQHRRLRRDARRPHPQGQALVLRGHRAVASPAPAAAINAGQLDAEEPRSDGCRRAQVYTLIPDSAQLRSPTRVAPVHRQADLPHQPGPQPEPLRHRHADHRWRRRGVPGSGSGRAAGSRRRPRSAATAAADLQRRTLARRTTRLRRERASSTAFLDKRLLLDVRLGWHHQTTRSLPADGRGLGQRPRPAGTPGRHRRARAASSVLRNIARLRGSGPGDACCERQRHRRPHHDVPDAPGYLIGGPGFIDGTRSTATRARRRHLPAHRARPPRHQGRHRRRASAYYNHLKAYSGGAVLDTGENVAPGTSLLRLPPVRLPHRPGPAARPGPHPAVDEQVGHRRRLRPGQLEHPRQGHPQPRRPLRRADLSARTARSASRCTTSGRRASASSTTSPSRAARRSSPTTRATTRASRSTSPTARSPASAEVNSASHDRVRAAIRSGTGLGCTATATTAQPRPVGSPATRTRLGVHRRRTRSRSIPNLKPQSSDEIVVGGEYEVIAERAAWASTTPTASSNRVIEDMSRDEANTYFIGNPG